MKTKHTNRVRGWISLMAVAILLALGVVALAETFDAAQPTEAVEATQTTEAAEATQDELYQQALTQYQSARQDNELADFETQLADMVNAGQLTQEQSDLLLTRVKAQLSIANGLCPDCGASLPGVGRGNKSGMSGRGGRGGNAGRMGM